MDAEMASWKSTGTYVDAVPPSGANIVSGMWIFRVKRPPGSPPVFKARYVARGFSQRQGVDYFQTFSPTLKMTTLRVLLHVSAHRDYELHSLDFSTAFLQGSLHEEIWLRRPPGFTGSFPPGTQWSLRRPVYGLRQAPREWHDTLRTTLAALGFAPSTADPSLFLRTDTSLPPFYILVYVDDLVFATADTAGLAYVKSELQKRHTCTDLGELRSYLGLQITRDRAQRTITLTQSHMVQQVLQRFGFTYSSPQATPLPTRFLFVPTSFIVNSFSFSHSHNSDNDEGADADGEPAEAAAHATGAMVDANAEADDEADAEARTEEEAEADADAVAPADVAETADSDADAVAEADTDATEGGADAVLFDGENSDDDPWNITSDDDVPLLKQRLRHRLKSKPKRARVVLFDDDSPGEEHQPRFTTADKGKRAFTEAPAKATVRRRTSHKKRKNDGDPGSSTGAAKKKKKKTANKDDIVVNEALGSDDDYVEAVGPIPSFPEKEKPKDPTLHDPNSCPPSPRSKDNKKRRRGWTVREKLKWARRYHELGSLKKTSVESTASIACIRRWCAEATAGVYKGAANCRKWMHGGGGGAPRTLPRHGGSVVPLCLSAAC
ncbi:unnamed protein product [Closterium sp. NIES-54]